MLLTHWARRAASRAAWTAGNSRAISTAMMAITTRSSISVNARRAPIVRFMGHFLRTWESREGSGRRGDHFTGYPAPASSPVRLGAGLLRLFDALELGEWTAPLVFLGLAGKH